MSPLALADPLGAGSFDELISADAVQLFAARAQAVKRDFAVNPENVEAVAAICERLDGLPLAIELAAARIRVLPPAALLDRLDPRLPLLTGGPRDRPSHQQTVRDTIAWSYDLLDVDDQALFRQLSLFVGGFSLAAAEDVAQRPDVLDGIANLIDQSLIQQAVDALGETRYTMLETVREFGLELLLATPEEKSARARHADWMLEYAADAANAWCRTDYALWSDRLEVDRGNLRAASSWTMETGQMELAMGLAIGSNRFWRTRGPVSEGVDWLERALALEGEVPLVLRVQALELVADLVTVAGNLDLAMRRATEGEALAREIGDPGRLDMVLSVRARILFLLGRTGCRNSHIGGGAGAWAGTRMEGEYRFGSLQSRRGYTPGRRPRAGGAVAGSRIRDGERDRTDLRRLHGDHVPGRRPARSGGNGQSQNVVSRRATPGDRAARATQSSHCHLRVGRARGGSRRQPRRLHACAGRPPRCSTRWARP